MQVVFAKNLLYLNILMTSVYTTGAPHALSHAISNDTISKRFNQEKQRKTKFCHVKTFLK